MSMLKGLLRDRLPWKYRVIGLLSVLIAGSPFVLGFSIAESAQLTTTPLSIPAFALCAYQIFYSKVRNR